MTPDDRLALFISIAVPVMFILWPAFWYRRGVRSGLRSERRRWQAAVKQVDAANQAKIDAARVQMESEWARRLENGPAL